MELLSSREDLTTAWLNKSELQTGPWVAVFRKTRGMEKLEKFRFSEVGYVEKHRDYLPVVGAGGCVASKQSRDLAAVLNLLTIKA